MTEQWNDYSGISSHILWIYEVVNRVNCILESSEGQKYILQERCPGTENLQVRLE